MWDRIGPSATFVRLRQQAPALAETLPELAQRALKLLTSGGSDPNANAAAIEALRGEVRAANRRNLFAVAAATAWLCAILLYNLTAHSSSPISTVALCAALGIAGLWCWNRALRKEPHHDV
jgi:ubiquinone biosynthesis protein